MALSYRLSSKQDITRLQLYLISRAEIMLHEIYSRKDFMKPSDRDKFLFDNIELHLAHSTHQIMSWTSVHQPLISHSIKETDRLAIRGVISIRTYFPAPPSWQGRHANTTYINRQTNGLAHPTLCGGWTSIYCSRTEPTTVTNKTCCLAAGISLDTVCSTVLDTTKHVSEQ